LTKHSIGVIGLGYVGLPVAQAAVRSGNPVIGFDVSESVVAGLALGKSHVDDLSDTDIADMLSKGLRPTTDTDLLSECSTFVICVPTPLSEHGGPDLAAVEAAGRTVAKALSPGDLVVLESTSYPGTTNRVLRPLLEASGLRAGRDFGLAFSPERIDPGNPVFTFVNTPKIVGGLTPECRTRAADFYGGMVNEVVLANGLEEAELAKLLENTYRVVNIALVNEMARFCHDLGIDLWNAIECASSKPFGFQAFQPGPGVGGHCIPIDPTYLSFHVQSEAGYSFRFVELAQEINGAMPSYVVSRIGRLLNSLGKPFRDSQVLLVGITYKADVADTRETPATRVAQDLLRLGAKIEYLDPQVGSWKVDGRLIPRRVNVNAEGVDCCVFLQHHSDMDPQVIAQGAASVLDTRGKLRNGCAEIL
jgi:UDP-N-acetyl-D-glucosamine dehydrogenase